MKAVLFAAVILLGACDQSHSEDFDHRRVDLGALVVEGSLLECEAPSARVLARVSPQAFSWAVTQGFARRSGVTGTPTYTAKVQSTDAQGQPVLIVGCWVTTHVVKEVVDGRQVVLAKATFRMNDILRFSPFADLAVCKRKGRGEDPFVQGDYRVVYEVDVIGCKSDPWKELLPSVLSLERETALFQLRRSQDNRGYVRSVLF